MRRWIALSAYLYPRAWRERYGGEFDALLEDAAADWRQLWNVTYGAFAMQLTNGMAYLKAAGGLALAGGILALVASYRVPPRYVSSTVVRIVPVVNDNRPVAKEVLRRAAANSIGMLQGFGRMFITERAASQVLRWKPGDRDRTIREVADKHLDDLQIRPVALAGENGFAVRVSFADADRVKAQAGLTKLVTQAQEFNELMNGDNVLFWKYLYHQPVPFTERIEVRRSPRGTSVRFGRTHQVLGHVDTADVHPLSLGDTSGGSPARYLAFDCLEAQDGASHRWGCGLGCRVTQGRPFSGIGRRWPSEKARYRLAGHFVAAISPKYAERWRR